ncbi:hypothetical protein [Novosphingobium sp. 9U]|uniref:hypothetical protein n=1 Tax=Novosphingobium sp. 9U TaxID=2653158 RepID=UPI0013592E34|nr:hypothetical protein [Novosphingobium sp. 9U]
MSLFFHTLIQVRGFARLLVMDDENVELSELDSPRYQYVRRLKRTITGQAVKREKAFEWAKRMAPQVERARQALEASQSPEDRNSGKRFDSDEALARWLNAKGARSVDGHRGISRQLFSRILNEQIPNYVSHCVFECRTRMTAMALSADFETADAAVDRLEIKYITYIAEALALGRRFRGEFPAPHEMLMAEARAAAIEVAQEQRKGRQSTMAAREGLWKDYKPSRPVRRVFRT